MRNAPTDRAVDPVPLGLVRSDVEGRILEASDRFLACLGYDRDALRAGRLSWRALTPDRWHPADDGAASWQKECLHREGRPVPVLVETVAVDPPRGEVLAFVVDLTAPRRAEARLARAERELSQLVERAPMGVWRLGHDGTVLQVNGAGRALIGCAAEELIGRDLRAHARDPAEVSALFERAAAAGAASGCVSLVRADGSVRETLFDVDARCDGGAVGSLCVFTRDLTEVRSLEAQLRQAQKMEAVGLLAGGVAHDFNNVLAVVLCNADVLADELPPDSPARVLVEEIREAADRAAGLTRQLLTIGRKQHIAPQTLDLRDLVPRTVRLLRRVIAEHIDLAVELPDVPCRVVVDPGQLEHVLLNLAVNARDAMPDGGRLTVSVEPPTAEAPTTALVVSDTGHGMSEAVLNRIFEPFFTTKAPGLGSGLGLATVYGIVRQSGGEIDVRSVPGGGTSFRILLPALVEEPPPAPAARPRPLAAAPSARGELVLLVEDEAVLRRIAERGLRRAGYRVLVAADGAEALRLSEAHGDAIDAVVTDVVMPGLGGLELGRALSARRPDLPLLFMSGYAGRFGAEALPPDAAYIQKPFTAGQLATRLREVLSARPAWSAHPGRGPAAARRAGS